VPLAPRQVYEDQVKLKRENELKTNCESESSKKEDEKESVKRKYRVGKMRGKQKNTCVFMLR
jgi:hypothetical protein